MTIKPGKRHALIGSLAVGGLLAVMGCANHHGEPTSPPKVIHAVGPRGDVVLSKDLVRGHLFMVGGPAPGTARPLPGTVTFTGTLKAQVSVGKDGRFATWLPPGRYHVGGRSPLFGSGRYPCQAASYLVVRPQQPNPINVYCQAA